MFAKTNNSPGITSPATKLLGGNTRTGILNSHMKGLSHSSGPGENYLSRKPLLENTRGLGLVGNRPASAHMGGALGKTQATDQEMLVVQRDPGGDPTGSMIKL